MSDSIFYWRIIILAAFVLACPVGYFAFNHLRKKTDPAPSFLLVMIAGLVESAGGLLVFFNEIADISNIVLIAGGLFIAGGMTPLVIAWAQYSAALSLRKRVALTATAAFVGALSALLISLLPALVAIVITASLPITSALIWVFSPAGKNLFIPKPPTNQPGTPSPYNDNEDPKHYSLVFITLAFGMEFTLMAHVIIDTSWRHSSAPGLLSLGVFLLVEAVLSLLMVFHLHHENPTLAFRPAIPLCIIGFILAPLLGKNEVIYAIAIAFAGFGCFCVYYWIVLGNICVADNRSTGQVYTKGLFILALGMAAGEALSYIIQASADPAVYAILVSLTALSAFSLALWYTARGEIFADEPTENQRALINHANQSVSAQTFIQNIDSQQSISGFTVTTPETRERLERFCSLFGISAREHQILELWLKGRNVPYICDELFITKNTVQTHLKHLYAKTGVSGRQELIDLVERFI
ncbi:MAG: helix-turn-helix transcriptional regulator [Actinobacteria bacterium]|nr:helix-turn-helix transcriptional regulator [Actinomycetota bacterium]